ncbi:CHASE2 domain-containing protein [Diaphorobacter ruginosibacter]|uniref:histidine kinase n=1 Tax=Diaphorobacter ruginosibacter TaxID=1715720 RepID=A0A7G9RLB6_9BURK|nr:CHASE2 domain-containing protein [Diaphorobacter ruginosibacter]QNN56391.1 CHASE2 domain-containing protein [Diaphorobacter ruginosibacter]
MTLFRANSRAQWQRREWSLLTVALLCLVTWACVTGALQRVDHLIHDAGGRLFAPRANPDIVMVAIDDRSINAIGRWPWRRALHAQLIDVISEQSPQAVGMDVLFIEEDADYPGDDIVLAQAVARSGHVVLPVTRRSEAPQAAIDAPLDLVRQAASQLGHVHVQVDSDGVVRRLHLFEGPAGSPLPHFAIAMLCAAGNPQPGCRGTQLPPGGGEWTRDTLRVIPFAAGAPRAPAFTTYSYIDVLMKRVPPDAFRGKLVLVGATATGLGDMFAAPVAPESDRIPGVELVAHVLNALVDDIRITPAPLSWNLVFNLLPVAAALMAVLLLGPFTALLACGLMFVAMLLTGAVTTLATGWQLSPASGMMGVLLCYPLWSWRRLSAAAMFLRQEMHDLTQDGVKLPAPAPARSHRILPSDFLERRIHAVEQATQQLRELHHFVSDSLRQLPSPTFVCDSMGVITLANAAAARMVEDTTDDPTGHALAELLGDFVHIESATPLLPLNPYRWSEVPGQQECRDDKGRYFLLLCKPFAANSNAGWLITMVDLTDMRRAQKQRDEALNFISHDIRSPNASIITLLEMHREYPDQVPMSELLPRIERYAQSSLSMAEGFVRLASAQSQTYSLATFDLAALLEQSVDDAWAPAQDNRIQVRIDAKPDAAPCWGDRSMLSRAIGNVMSNALKFSPAQSVIHCSLLAEESDWIISIRDEGPGIPPDKRASLFQPFRRLHENTLPGVQGIGLGLALVRTVIERHAGHIDVVSEPGQGTEFRLHIPRAIPEGH